MLGFYPVFLALSLQSHPTVVEILCNVICPVFVCSYFLSLKHTRPLFKAGFPFLLLGCNSSSSICRPSVFPAHLLLLSENITTLLLYTPLWDLGRQGNISLAASVFQMSRFFLRPWYLTRSQPQCLSKAVFVELIGLISGLRVFLINSQAFLQKEHQAYWQNLSCSLCL